MESSFTHTGFLHYHLNLFLDRSALFITLTINELDTVRKYRTFFTNYSIPIEIKKEVETVGDLFAMFGDKRNFKVDPVEGEMILILRRGGSSKFEKKVEIKLNFIGAEEKQIDTIGDETNTCEEFGGEIKEFEFPEFDDEEGRIIEGFEREMAIFRGEMEWWKRKLEEKKEEIKHKKRRKYSEEREFQGEEKDGKKDGFGLMFIVHGKLTGVRYEGEFKRDCANGLGICYFPEGNRYEGEWKDGVK